MEREFTVPEVWVRSGMDPDDPEAVVVAVVMDPKGSPEERAVLELGNRAHEMEDCFGLLQTDGWAERRLDGEVLTVDIVAYPFEGLEIDAGAYFERSLVDQEAVRLLRVSSHVARPQYERALDLTAVVMAPAGTSDKQIAAGLQSGELWPLILDTPPPAEI
ncbi:hypothetical protein I3F58_10520 [Streptomyces sp. MUM 203J]|uniref:hypothetical protein n=1 Tax=Streptomyces sp. MUM 203J TaxID=2791990 RepID=UPI001F04CE12|nr:hypothetical protein [Streptomyces sp. MUM 203J]MCH0539991.1 hypothetical protein [Streptomyces sp. MUM 203J]